MELMQKYVKEGGAIGVDNPQRWSNSDALGFLSATESVASVEELLKVCLTLLPPSQSVDPNSRSIHSFPVYTRRAHLLV